MEHLLSSFLLVALPGCFGFEVSARQLSAERGAVRAWERRTNCEAWLPDGLVSAESKQTKVKKTGKIRHIWEIFFTRFQTS